MKVFWRRPVRVVEIHHDDEIADLRNAVHAAGLKARIAVQETGRLQVALAAAERKLRAEETENERLNKVINTLLRQAQTPNVSAGAAPVGVHEPVFLRAELARCRANAARLEDRLAMAEGRVTYARSGA